jgi:hypothetical protein
MTAAGLAWISLAPSRMRRAWLRAAAGLSGLLALTLSAAALIEPTVGLLAGTAAAAAAVLLAGWAAQATPPAVSLSIDAGGALWLRHGATDAAAVPVKPVFASDRLVTLRSGRRTMAVWRDSLPPDAYRRLCAHVRWHVPRGGQAAPGATRPVEASNRPGSSDFP